MLENKIKEFNSIGRITIGKLTIGLLAYANDLALSGNNKTIVKQHFRKLIIIAYKRGLKYINDKKTEYVIIDEEEQKTD